MVGDVESQSKNVSSYVPAGGAHTHALPFHVQFESIDSYVPHAPRLAVVSHPGVALFPVSSTYCDN